MYNVKISIIEGDKEENFNWLYVESLSGLSEEIKNYLYDVEYD